MAQEKVAQKIRVARQRCPYCHDAIPHGEAPAVCAQCHALHHQDCLEEHGACATCASPITRAPGAPRSYTPRRQQSVYLGLHAQQPRPPRPMPRWTAGIPALIAAVIGLLLSYDSPTWRGTLIVTGFFAIIGLIISYDLFKNPPRRPG